MLRTFEYEKTMIELTDAELFKDLVLIDQDGIAFDVHNDYDCINMTYEKKEPSLILYFEASSKKETTSCKRIRVEFKEATLVKFDLILNRTTDSATINNIYRGRFEQEGKLLEYSDDGARYFYIEFETGDKVELFSKQVLFFAS